MLSPSTRSARSGQAVVEKESSALHVLHGIPGVLLELLVNRSAEVFVSDLCRGSRAYEFPSAARFIALGTIAPECGTGGQPLGNLVDFADDVLVDG